MELLIYFLAGWGSVAFVKDMYKLWTLLKGNH